MGCNEDRMRYTTNLRIWMTSRPDFNGMRVYIWGIIPKWPYDNSSFQVSELLISFRLGRWGGNSLLGKS
jgi:hypothetical protein